MNEGTEDAQAPLLSRITAILGSLAALFLGGSGAGYFLSPALQKEDEGWVDLGKADSFKTGDPSKVEFVERRKDAWVTTERRSSAWVLVSEGKKFTVFDPKCPHLGCPYRWNVQDKHFQCPCHTAVFGLNGKVISGPSPRALDHYEAKVQDKRLMILPEAKKEEL